ncbi:diguanylate cyclase [Hydrogenimonas cancrithermarum]|uniref:diguanylate cyclase n=1 Tax=Hydrogenimonas cancrithermarum TaxID=2993563 RepID=A0ABN6WSJ8_9BACT|nr:diguanylate cyclase [Hydrogenimonas cancrithermarum]BDY11791.1 hypothetical protein HCR_01030 [Hydrogenimonas cancrithermarum]
MKVTRQFDLVLNIGIFLLSLLTIAMIYLYLQVDKVLLSTRQDMINTIVERYVMEFQNAARLVVEETGSPLFEKLSRDRSVREHLQMDLSYFRTPEVEHLFVVFKDEHGRYRYLLDTEEDPNEQAMFMQRFEPVSSIWDDVYTRKKSEVYKHEKEGYLWVTLATPIIENGHVVAILGSDLSAAIRSDVEQRFVQIKSIMLGIAIGIAVLLVFGYAQVYYYYKGRKISFIDPLTGAYNRKFLYEVLSNTDYSKYKIIMYDVDYFKQVNDTYGHEVGDRVLQHLTKRIQKQLRHEDYLIRFGGEEFIVFLNTPDEFETIYVAKRLKQSIESSPFVSDEKIIHITISLGINTDLSSASNLDDAIEIADRQLYCAKHAGRNRICINGEVV